MKPRRLLLLIALTMFFGTSAYAKVGDVIGNIYTTDIMAVVDGMPIKSYNIGGRTAIVVEDLREYGFYVEWNGDKRTVTVKTEYKPVNVPAYTHIKQTPGKVAGRIYETDIVVTVNGLEIPSFNLGGITAVSIEEMVDLPYERYSHDGNSHQGMDRYYADTGMYYVWYGDERKISLNTLRPGDVVDTNLGEFTITSKSWSIERMMYVRSWKTLKKYGESVPKSVEGFEIGNEVYLDLKDVIDVIGAEYTTFDDGVNIILDTENTETVRYERYLTDKTCYNILYPLKSNVFINEKTLGTDIGELYLYKGKVFVSINAVNKALEKELFIK